MPRNIMCVSICLISTSQLEKMDSHMQKAEQGIEKDP